MTEGTKLTLEEFWALPEGETAYELVDVDTPPPKVGGFLSQRVLSRATSWLSPRHYTDNKQFVLHPLTARQQIRKPPIGLLCDSSPQVAAAPIF